MKLDLRLGDCLDLMPTLPNGSIDMILCDLPYGTTQNKWDSVIPFEPLWENYWRILKPSGVICLNAGQPFTAALVMSQPKFFRHEWVWIKNRGSNFANTVREPMKEHESILMFSRGKWTYNKQMQERTGGGASRVAYEFNSEASQASDNFGKVQNKRTPILSPMRVPSSHQKFNTEVGLHPTQKPVALMEYLINTYTNPGDTVLDSCMGSGTTGVACMNLARKFIGIEKDAKYFQIASERIRASVPKAANDGQTESAAIA